MTKHQYEPHKRVKFSLSPIATHFIESLPSGSRLQRLSKTLLLVTQMKKASHCSMTDMVRWEALISLGSERGILWFIHGAFNASCG